MKHSQSLKEVEFINRIISTSKYDVYRDKYPVTPGHLLYVPYEDNWECLGACWEAAYIMGQNWLKTNYCDGYNIGQNVGIVAGQTVIKPHVHLIPRRKGDTQNPTGGIRCVIPEKADYTNEEKNTT